MNGMTDVVAAAGALVNVLSDGRTGDMGVLSLGLDRDADVLVALAGRQRHLESIAPRVPE